jgi:DNA-binding NtrC family response regulator
MPTSRPVLAFPAPLRYPQPKNASAASSGVEMVGEGDAMRRLRLQIQRMGPHFRTMLVRGEIGTGKELVARALHSASMGSGGPFVVCHAAALEDAAADGTREEWLRALIETSRRGTLFLDGIEEMPMAAQAQLLASLRKKTSQQVIASTSEDLRSLAASGRFRQDLYHRIATVEIGIVPLRERAEDIASLASAFVDRFARLYGRPIHAIAESAMERLSAHTWPGNVRELENVVRNGVLQCEGPLLRAHDLTSLRELKMEATLPSVAMPARLQDVIDQHVQQVLRNCAGNKVKAAEALGISRSTLYRMLDGISIPGS